MPRSGSTMLQAILSNNTEIDTRSEPWLLLPLISILKKELGSAKYNSYSSATAIKEFIDDGIGQSEYNKALRHFVDQCYSLNNNTTSRYFLDKTPRYYEILQELVELLPDSKVIILKRNPVAAACSMISTWDKKNVDDLFEFERDLLYAPFLMQDFLQKNEENVNVIQVRYEDLLENPESEISNLCRFLDIPFNEDYLDYGRNTKYRGTFGDSEVVDKYSKPIRNKSDSWERKAKSSWYYSFVIGYASYLGHEFLKNYGNYHINNARKTNDFEYFKFLATKNIFTHNVTKGSVFRRWLYDSFSIRWF